MVDDGRTTEHGYTISSPCEPDSSGELIIGVPGKVVFLHYTTVYCAYLSVVLVPVET